MSEDRQRVALVIGGGPVGALAALSLYRRGWDVELWEARDDPRGQDAEKMTNLRSINLNISARGLEALRSVDPSLAEIMLNESIPMKSRMIHHSDGRTEAQVYDPMHGWVTNSLSRPVLNQRLIEALPPDITLHFNTKLARVDFQARKAYRVTRKKSAASVPGEETEAAFRTRTGEMRADKGDKEIEKPFDLIVGCDGTWSKVRAEIMRVERVNFSQDFISHAYIELHMPPDSTRPGGFAMEPNHLHIWPRHSFMLIALPNKNGSFTMTLFVPFADLDKLATPGSALAFFKHHFPSAVKLMGEKRIMDDVTQNPRGNLVTMHVNPTVWKSHAVLLGDAAHSMVPFYGQGLNCGLEDVRVLNSYLENHAIRPTTQSGLGETDPQLEKALTTYSTERDADLQAICQLALRNYTEMRSHVLSPLYLLRRWIDYSLTIIFPSKPGGDLSLTNAFPTKQVRGWTSLYEMVTFRADIAYAEALRRETWQKEVVGWATRAVGVGLVAGVMAGIWMGGQRLLSRAR